MVKFQDLPEDFLQAYRSAKIPLWGEINEEVVLRWCFEEIPKRIKEGAFPERVVLDINSRGGSAYALMGLYLLLKSSRVRIDTFVSGQALSAGFFAMMLGERRYALTTARFLMHEPQYKEMGGAASTLIKEVESSLATSEIWYRMIARKTGQSLDDLREKFEECFITVGDALHHGFITEIVEPFE